MTPDAPNPILIRQLQEMLTGALARVRKLVENPPGGSDAGREWNRQRYASIHAQITRELDALKRLVAQWGGQAVSASAARGNADALRQLRQLSRAGWTPPGQGIDPHFAVVNFDSVRVLARDTVADLSRAIDATQESIGRTLRTMADNGLTVREVNEIMSRGMIAGKPRDVVREITQSLQAIHGERLTIPTKGGGTMEYQTRDYAGMVARTRLREASVIARHERLDSVGIRHVVIIGNRTQWPCTAYLGKIYCLGKSDGKYPSIASIDGPPFHPNCSKSTAPIVVDLATKQQLAEGRPDQSSRAMARVGVNSPAARRLMQGDQVQAQVKQRMKKITRSITGGS